MKLGELLKAIRPLQVIGEVDVEITGIDIDSRKVEAGHLFMAIRGTQTDGHAYIQSALEKGARAILCEELPDDLAEHVTKMCELPSEYTKRIEVTSVSLNYGGPNHTEGATITAKMMLENSNAPLNINTPNKAFEMYNADADPDPKVLLSEDCVEAIEALEQEAKKYIAGYRAQGNLFEAQKEVA